LAIPKERRQTESSTSIKNKSKKDLTHSEDLSECVRSIKNNTNQQQTKNEKDKTQNQQKPRIDQAGILDTIQSLATKK